MKYLDSLYDIDFLYKLSIEKQREIYARITSLTWDEKPIEFIQGKVTGGSINVDGSSAIRRTCNLTLIAKDINIKNIDWGLNTKFKLELGLRNNINKNYPDIIWFKQGLFIITTFNTSISTNNYQISISGKDKMCLLNGDISGTLPHTTDFGIEEYYNSDCDVIYFNIDSVESDDVSKKSDRSNSKESLFVRYKATKDDSIFRLDYPEPWGKMIRRQFIEDNKILFDETRVANDYYFSIQVGCLARKVSAVNKEIYILTNRVGSVSHAYADTIDKLMTRIDVYQRVDLFLKKHNINMKPSPLRGLMVLLMKKSPKSFLKTLVFTLFLSMSLSQARSSFALLTSIPI